MRRIVAALHCDSQQGQPLEQLQGQAQEQRGLEILQAMIMAARARNADLPQASREIYTVSAVMIDEQNPMERAWLDQLASALNLDTGMARELEQQIRVAANA